LKRNFLVIGSGGLLGNSLVSLFNQKKYNYVASYNTKKPIYKTPKLIKCNLEKLSEVIKITKSIDKVYMCGGLVYTKNSGMTEEDFFYKNIKIFLNLFKACLKNRVKTVTWISSSSVYYNIKSKNSETSKKKKFHKLNVSGFYYFCEFISNFLNKFKLIKVIYIRTGNIYGENDYFFNLNRSQVLPNLIREIDNLKNSQKLNLNKNIVRDFVYANDLAKAMLMIANYKINLSPINFSSGKGLSLVCVSKKIGKILSKQKIIINNSKKKDIRVLSNSKFDKHFKKFKRVNFDKIILKVVKAYKNEKKKNTNLWSNRIYWKKHSKLFCKKKLRSC